MKSICPNYSDVIVQAHNKEYGIIGLFHPGFQVFLQGFPDLLVMSVSNQVLKLARIAIHVIELLWRAIFLELYQQAVMLRV
jgi:hypothetical protein